MDDYRCHNCNIPLDYNNAFGWVLYVEGPRRIVYLKYCPNCGKRLDKPPDHRPLTPSQRRQAVDRFIDEMEE